MTYSATVSPHPSGGTVAFTDDGVDITGCSAIAVGSSTGSAACTTTYTASDRHTIQAAFSGAGDENPSTSPTLTQTITAIVPSVSTGPASSITPTGGTVTGTVNPEGQSTTYQFDYGTSTAYGFHTARVSAGSGTAAETEQATLSGLKPGTTYYYRIQATNASGTTFGTDQALNTRSSPTPVITTSSGHASGFSDSDVVLGFTLTSHDTKVSSFTIHLPAGLTFSGKHGKHHASDERVDATRTRVSKITIVGAKVKHETITAGKATIVLKGAAAKLSITLSHLLVRPSLRAKIKAQNVKKLSSTLTATTTNGTRKTIEYSIAI